MRWYSAFFLALLLILVPAASLSEGEQPAKEVPVEEKTEGENKPNILFVMTDDQDPASVRNMPQLQRLMVDEGTSFSRSYVTTPQCCPSRTTMLRGQYAHNHGIKNNKLPEGGAIKLRRDRLDKSTIATWMKDAGYDTAYVGKYLNEYEALYVPPGWDRWYGFMGAYSDRGTGEYDINENGKRHTYKLRRLHDTDYMARKAGGFIRARENSSKPWFMVVTPNAPHSPAYAAKRHENLFKKAKLPRPPSFNEKDVSDKPPYVRNEQRLSPAGVKQLEEDWRQRMRSLRSVDEMVGELVSTLEESGQLDNTYIVYTTDNGYMLGKHRLKTKGVPYEESIKAPFIVRGPSVPEGVARNQLVASTDWAPTIADWGGAKTPGFVDGRSLRPLLSESPPSGWRDVILTEFWHSRPFHGLRTASGLGYVEYENGEKELYDLRRDPYQIENTIGEASPNLLDTLSNRLEELKSCAAKSCRAAEDTEQ